MDKDTKLCFKPFYFFFKEFWICQKFLFLMINKLESYIKNKSIINKRINIFKANQHDKK